MECPVRCGACCYSPQYGDHEEICHYWSRQGCRLPRDRRPATCNEYLCPRAEKLLMPGGDGDE